MKNFKSKNQELSNIQIGNCFCVGRNYADHIKEMGDNLGEKPILFLKPSSSVLTDNLVKLPDYSNNIHHEVEIICVISKDCYQVKSQDAMKYVAGIGIGLDITLRDIQAIAKSKGNPWAVAKGFYGSAPISEIISIENFPNLSNLDFSLKINGVLRQHGNTSDMIMKFNELIEYISSFYLLQQGDIIYTGTPEGVAQLHMGDKAELQIENHITHNLKFE